MVWQLPWPAASPLADDDRLVRAEDHLVDVLGRDEIVHHRIAAPPFSICTFSITQNWVKYKG